MTKQNLQKELKEKVKEGVKPSDLKRSKSADGISQKGEENLKDDLKRWYKTAQQLQEENSELKKQLEQTTLALSELTKIRNDTPPAPLLQEQLKEKQKEVENLREKNEKLGGKLKEVTQELDNSLFARQVAVKQFYLLHEKLKQTKLELTQIEDEASDEIVSQDEEISKLKNQRLQFKQKIQSLERDLELAHRAVKWRENPIRFSYGDSASSYPFLKYTLYTLLAVGFALWLNNI